MDFIIINIIVSAGITLTIATILILINGKEKQGLSTDGNLKFDELEIDYSEMPAAKQYTCRDNVKLNYYNYSAKPEKILILLHGSGWHSKYFFSLAKYISSENIANVYTPDLRGHGINPIKRGDIKYINQLEDDIADFIEVIKKKHPKSKIIVGGHSSGGGLAIRFAGSKYGKYVNGYIMLSPYLKYNAPTIRVNSGGWAFPRMPRIIGLSILNSFKIKWLNGLEVIDFNMPKEYRDGTETLSYSYRLNTGYAPRNYKNDFKKMKQKALIVAGESDESFIAENFLPEVSKYKEDIEVITLKKTTHMGVVVGDKIKPIIKKWINELK